MNRLINPTGHYLHPVHTSLFDCTQTYRKRCRGKNRLKTNPYIHDASIWSVPDYLIKTYTPSQAACLVQWLSYLSTTDSYLLQPIQITTKNVRSYPWAKPSWDKMSSKFLYGTIGIKLLHVRILLIWQYKQRETQMEKRQTKRTNVHLTVKDEEMLKEVKYHSRKWLQQITIFRHYADSKQTHCRKEPMWSSAYSVAAHTGKKLTDTMSTYFVSIEACLDTRQQEMNEIIVISPMSVYSPNEKLWQDNSGLKWRLCVRILCQSNSRCSCHKRKKSVSLEWKCTPCFIDHMAWFLL